MTIKGAPDVPVRTVLLSGTADSQGRERVTFDTTLPLAGLRPGGYTLELTARLAQAGGAPARRDVAFAIR
jgi:hypothetical protein